MKNANDEYFNKFDSASLTILQNSIDKVKEKDRRILLPSDILLEIAASDSVVFQKLCQLLDLNVGDFITELNWMSRTGWKSEVAENSDGIYISGRCRRLFRDAHSKSGLFVIPLAEDASRINIPGLLFAAMMPEDEEFGEILRLAGKSADYAQVMTDKKIEKGVSELEPSLVAMGKWLANPFASFGAGDSTSREERIAGILAKCV